MPSSYGITLRNFFFKLTHWEHWPFGILQFPVMLYWLWLSAKARSIFFFTGSNPGIEYGGMMGESKFDILAKVPADVAAKTIRMEWPTTAAEVLKAIENEGFSWPVIFKPDRGERGWMVKKIRSSSDIEPYLSAIKIPFLIQEFIDLPQEFGVFYVRHPAERSGQITSLVGKEMLHVIGDGKSTLQELILSNDRARIQWRVLRNTFHDDLHTIPDKDSTIELVGIGNHCLGTKFLDRTDLVTTQLVEAFDKISRRIDGFYYGRFDLRTTGVDDLRQGKVKVMELNGVGAEPAHIYQPGYSFWRAVAVMLRHWKLIYQISMYNADHGFRFPSWKEGREMYDKMKEAQR